MLLLDMRIGRAVALSGELIQGTCDTLRLDSKPPLNEMSFSRAMQFKVLTPGAVLK
jgi:hypothetical protein